METGQIPILSEAGLLIFSTPLLWRVCPCLSSIFELNLHVQNARKGGIPRAGALTQLPDCHAGTLFSGANTRHACLNLSLRIDQGNDRPIGCVVQPAPV